ncbi:uncharacterized protein MELLADRAFT_101078 [Melampsora larici-populina 98AG31]|uniref:Uncharacterized protein n=1 Tax=Melampsora larici-populina (strain 98AG31 / pathotype 3-4-7) TaxID=747676 RepID=F4R3J7_MELLP|nr:uncharacterized protein MELLADRAFT_101078 [Melampsora larici-populina 98AG31]EGG13156.1 hypothetical protein MELLADRAFT_101078 [Melampsora larici-populina 98AG31]
MANINPASNQNQNHPITEQPPYQQSHPNYNHLPPQYQAQVYHHPSRPSSQPQSNSQHPNNNPSHGHLIPTPNPQLLQSQTSIPPGYQINPSSVHPQPPSQPIINQPAYNKMPNLPQHQVPPPSHPIMRPSQHQMAQHLMNPQAHIRSQRLIQQQQQIQHQQQMQRYEEIMMITDPLDSLNNRSLAARRYTSCHANMNSLLGNHWTVNAILKGDHKPSNKRKLSDPTDSNEPTEQDSNRKERLKQKLEKIQVDIEKSKKSHQLQLQMILDRSIPIQSESD